MVFLNLYSMTYSRYKQSYQSSCIFSWADTDGAAESPNSTDGGGGGRRCWNPVSASVWFSERHFVRTDGQKVSRRNGEKLCVDVNLASSTPPLASTSSLDWLLFGALGKQTLSRWMLWERLIRWLIKTNLCMSCCNATVLNLTENKMSRQNDFFQLRYCRRVNLRTNDVIKTK